MSIDLTTNELESAVLDWISAETGSAELSAQIQAAEPVKRDFMGTGLFLYLSAADNVADIPADVRPVTPRICSPMLMDGAGASLFMKNGRIHYLEVYSRGGFMPETLENWELQPESD